MLNPDRKPGTFVAALIVVFLLAGLPLVQPQSAVGSHHIVGKSLSQEKAGPSNISGDADLYIPHTAMLFAAPVGASRLVLRTESLAQSHFDVSAERVRPPPTL